MKKNMCFWFSGLGIDVCGAGVNIREACDGTTPGVGLRIPCIQDGKPDRESCEKFRLPTEEEIAREEAEYQLLIDRIEKAVPLINSVKAEHKGVNWSGVKECPACGVKLHLSHAACNGHVWGKCETEDCLNFAE